MVVGGNRRLVDCYSMPVFVFFGLNRLCWIHTFYKHIYFTCICTKLLKHNSLISSHQSFMCAADSGGNTKEKKERGKKGGTAMHVSSGQDITVTRISGVGVAFIGQIRAGLCWNLLTVRVWRERNTALNENHVVGTIVFGGGGVTVRGSFSNDCKLFYGSLTVDWMVGNTSWMVMLDYILIIMLLLAGRPMFQDGKSRLYWARVVREFIKEEDIESLPWPAMSPDMNLIEHLWDLHVNGHKINKRNPRCHNVNELRVDVVEEWQWFPRY